MSIISASNSALAWGKRGHEIVASMAARLLEEKEKKGFLRNHEFDLGYYANVPDIIWRNMGKKIGDTEGPEHYIDWNGQMAAKIGAIKELPAEFSDYKQKLGGNPDLKHVGAVPYRIHGFVKRCKKLSDGLSQSKQGPLLVCLGELAHYTGDLGMPLHTTDNHDGQMTHQDGIHGYFENTMVNALDPELKVEVLKAAEDMYDKHPAQSLKSDAAVRWLIEESYGKVDDVLKIDAHMDRKDIPFAAKKYHDLIVNQLAQATVVTALVWKEILSNVHSFDEDKFYFFDGRPDYVQPGKE